ncbi:MAG: deoxynucleoside kinase [Phaeodactylibacter sp.]|nr:deoxynucleoside kinase [Phaeodactylibacter sp.]
MEHPFPHRFIAIEGNIGAGKTTFAKMLERDYQAHLVLEQFTDNPFLPFFYENPDRYAFPVELFFMTERHKQLQEEIAQQQLFQQLLVSDYYFIKTLLFAQNNLRAEEFRLFQRLFHILNNSFPQPNLLVYLHRTIPNLLQNIKNRGRAYEQQIEGTYLESLQVAYFNYFRSKPNIPILILTIENVAFWEDEAAYRQMVELLTQTYAPGVHRATVEPQNGAEITS